ncbi:MAG: hypothetical protein QY312_01425 [Candidatus Dojkabacteria bacterium]|nr:MAG: hypothetical protein QY312_01425 [Candidatus Dojkabacteria bacterium]
MTTRDFTQKYATTLAVLSLAILTFSAWFAGKGIVDYAVWYMNPPQMAVLGEQDQTPTVASCLPHEQVSQKLEENETTITLFAPNQSVTFPVKEVAHCFQAIGCDAEGFTCNIGEVTVDTQCAMAYFRQQPLGVEEYILVTGSGAVAQVLKHDWRVNYENLAEQLKTTVATAVPYCQLTGEAEQTRKNIGSIQLVVSDEMPSMAGTQFTQQYVEIDASKEKVYFWNDGVYQTLNLERGARLPSEGIYTRKTVDLSKLVNSSDFQYLEKNTSDTTFVVVHR